MYGVLYAYTPEVLPAPHRGTGVGLASTFCRICNTMVPIIASECPLQLETMPNLIIHLSICQLEVEHAYVDQWGLIVRSWFVGCHSALRAERQA
jgi:hypothetical protein